MNFKLSKNINTTGRILRFVIGVLLLVFAYLKMSWILLFFALFVFFEVLMSWCILYQILGKSSCSIRKKP